MMDFKMVTDLLMDIHWIGDDRGVSGLEKRVVQGLSLLVPELEEDISYLVLFQAELHVPDANRHLHTELST